MGSLSSHGLKGRIGQQWSEHKSQNGDIIRNNFSQQQFCVYEIPNLQINNIKMYFSRQFSSLPKTPKIICLQRKIDHLLILVQRGDKLISQWLGQNHCQLSILMRLKEIIISLNVLRNKYGQFLITEKMIKVSSQNDNLLCWYNERYQSNLIQLPLINQVKGGQNEKFMVQNIIQIFRRSVSINSQTNKQFNINSIIPVNKTFSQFKSIVKKKIQQIQFYSSSSLASLNSQTTNSQKSQQTINISLNQQKQTIKYSLTPNKYSLTPQKAIHNISKKNNKQTNQSILYQTNNYQSTSLSKTLYHSHRKSDHNHRRSDHSPNIRIIDQNQVKVTYFNKQKRKIKFLLQQTHQIQQKALFNRDSKNIQKPLSSLSQQSSQNYSQSNTSSLLTKIQNSSEIQKDKISKSFNSASSSSPNPSQRQQRSQKQQQNNKIFKKKQFKFYKTSASKSSKKPYIKSITIEPKITQQFEQQFQKGSQQFVNQKVFQATTTASSTSGSLSIYKGCDSFSSKKHFSLKSTTGTLKKTRQFQQNIRVLLQQHQTIRQQSDQTHKNSNNYSIQQSIKEDRQQRQDKDDISIEESNKQQMKGSVSLSQDFNKLFSMAGSVASGMEDSMRQKQFEKILFGNHY